MKTTNYIKFISIATLGSALRSIVLPSLVAFALISCQEKKEHADEKEEDEDHVEGVVELNNEQISTIGIKIGEIESKQLSGTIQATGTLKLSPQSRAEVTSLVTGIAKRILVKEGDNVHAGQTVAMVENTEIVALQKDYLVASRQLTLARQAYQRQQNMQSQSAGVEKNLQQAKSDLDIATVTEQGIRQQLKQLGINPTSVAGGKFTEMVPVVSPINGVVGEIAISTGTFLNNDTKLMNVYNNSALHADINVFESNISSIKLGQSVDLQLSDKSAKGLKGKVSFITASLDKDTKAASVHVALDNKNGNTLLPNMFVSAAIHCENQLCNAVPNSAIVMNANRSFVFISLGDGKFKQAEVVTGIVQQGYTQITFIEKQPANLKIVTDKAFYLQSMVADHGEHDH